MSAERLRAAAAKLREAVAAVPPSPWKSWGMDLLSDPVGNSNVDDGIPVVRGLVPEGERLRTHTIDYVQTMQPVVALALADWMDAEVIECEALIHPRVNRDGLPRRDAEREVYGKHPALLVADAILGGTK